MRAHDAEFAIVGLGAHGAQAFWRLAARGTDVIGFEQFLPGHDRGSTHGQTRLFRTLCLEHPGLVPLARRSLGLWRELEEQTSTSSSLMPACCGYSLRISAADSVRTA